MESNQQKLKYLRSDDCIFVWRLITMLNFLPTEILVHIFSYLASKNLNYLWIIERICFQKIICSLKWTSLIDSETSTVAISIGFFNYEFNELTINYYSINNPLPLMYTTDILIFTPDMFSEQTSLILHESSYILHSDGTIIFICSKYDNHQENLIRMSAENINVYRPFWRNVYNYLLPGRNDDHFVFPIIKLFLEYIVNCKTNNRILNSVLYNKLIEYILYHERNDRSMKYEFSHIKVINAEMVYLGKKIEKTKDIKYSIYSIY